MTSSYNLIDHIYFKLPVTSSEQLTSYFTTRDVLITPNQYQSFSSTCFAIPVSLIVLVLAEDTLRLAEVRETLVMGHEAMYKVYGTPSLLGQDKSTGDWRTMR